MRLPAVPGSQAALAVAHPGHELRVHGWLERARPTVFVLTDGSGRSGQSRLGSTTHVLARAGAEPGSIYGLLTDRALYAAILNGDVNLFFGLVDQLADALRRKRVEYVVGDAAEGRILAHDVWRLVINAAVGIVNRAQNNQVSNYDYLVVSRPDDCSNAPPATLICIRLNDEAFARKLGAARGYPEVADEAEETLKEMEIEAFRVEWLRLVDGWDECQAPTHEPPEYERHGEQRVAAGHYERVIRYREHVLPLAEALRRYLGRSDP